jgi:hypothetical protein
VIGKQIDLVDDPSNELLTVLTMIHEGDLSNTIRFLLSVIAVYDGLLARGNNCLY